MGTEARAVAPGFPLVTRFAGPEINASGYSLSAAQTDDGVMHFGCRDLLSFDGERWTATPLNHGYAIYDLEAAADGKLWVAAVGEIGWFERGATGWNYHSLVPQLPPDAASFGTAWHVYRTKSGVVFVCDDKVLQWNGTTFKAWPMTQVRHVRGLRAGERVFVQHRQTGVYEITDDGPVLFLPASVVGDAPIFFLESTGTDWLVVNSKGLFRGDARGFRPVAAAAANAEYFAQHRLTSVLRLPDGRFAVATADSGVVFLDAAGNLESPVNQLGAEERYISSLFLDRQGGLWATSDSAVYRIAALSPSRVFDERAQLAHQRINGIVGDRGHVVLLTSDKVYRAGSAQAGLETLPVTEGGIFSDLAASPSGLLLSGFHELVRVTDGNTRVLHVTQQDIVSISPWRNGRNVFADARDVFSVADDNTVRPVYRGLPTLPSSLAIDAHDRIWASSETGGVWCITVDGNGAHARSVGAADGVEFAVGPTRVAVAPNGTVLIFNRAGVWSCPADGERFARIDGFPADFRVPARPSSDSAGNLWCAAESNDARRYLVGRISFAGARPQWQPHMVEGLTQIGTPRHVFLEESPGHVPNLWIGGTTGVLRHELRDGLRAPRPGSPLLRASVRNAAGQFSPLAARLPYSTSSVDFEFAAPDFARRPLLRLETRIDGIDHAWLPAAPDSRRTLTAVRDGNYTFRVRAVAETGAASEPTVVSFTVLPPWWRTPLALLGVVVALVPFGYGIYRLRLQALHRRTVELETKVRQRTEQLEQANAAKTQFVANMSHDIRNPLNGIVGLALALEDTRLDPKQREIVATLRECTTYLSSLVDDVLDFASIEAGRVELRPGPFVPVELLGSIVTTTKTDTAESGARLLVDVDPALPKILSGDAGRIQQILVNYVSNALKYAGGTIHLTATIPLGSPDEIEFAVTDEGPGITAAEQATLFTKFTRLSGARDHEIPGAGLGLAACRLLADIMGGSVGVASEPGHGARFFLRLPLTRAEIPVPPADGELPNTTVLLVEDTDYNALAASAVLARLGLSCERARTGEEALQLFASKRYNIVLLDRNLPDMDGTEIARKMRAMESDGLRSILLAVTAYCTAEDRRLCLEAGMDAFVGKPLTPEKLRKILLAAGRRMLAAATFDVTPEAAATPAVDVDLSLLSYISDGAEGGLDTQVDRFLASLADHETQLVKALVAHDLAEIATAAHRILGQARMVGAPALTRVATELQAAGHAADAARCAALHARALAEIAALTAALRHRRSGALTS